jgi:hypothetical protein
MGVTTELSRRGRLRPAPPRLALWAATALAVVAVAMLGLMALLGLDNSWIMVAVGAALLSLALLAQA